MKRRTGLAVAAAGTVAGAAAWAAVDCRPWVFALRSMVRLAGVDEGPARSAALRAMVPADVTGRLDLHYDSADRDARLDVFTPPGGRGPLPTIVWVHGGGWIGGTKNDMREYLQLLAAQGFTTVGVDYSHAPRRRYPTPIRQLDAALTYLTEHAGELRVDAGRFVLGGDSAGAHIAAQAAAAITDPGYARAARLPASLPPERLRAVLLLCGIYDLSVSSATGRAKAVADTVLWAYSGTRRHRRDPHFAYASVALHVSAAFPPAFVSAGNGDPLVVQSVQMVDALTARGVDVDALFFDDHEPALPHEYHLDLPLPAAQHAFERMVAHVRLHTSGPEGHGE